MGKTCNESHQAGRLPASSNSERWAEFVANHPSDVEGVGDANANSIKLPQPGRTAESDEPIAALVFEVENVLCDGTTWRRWLLHSLAQLGLYTHYGPFFRIWDQDFLPEAQRGREPFVEVFRRFLQSAGLSRGAVDELIAAGMCQWQKLQQEARPFPCVRSTLANLQQSGIRLAVLTDTPETKLELCQKLVRLGLSELLPEVTTSRDLQAVKPEGSCYQASLDALGLQASQALFVGARSRDLQGAREAGMRTIAFNYEAHAQADAFVDRFVDLRQLSSGQASARKAA